MTEGQIKYQTLMENQRHNLELERQGAIDVQSGRSQAETAAKRQSLDEAKFEWQKIIDDYEKPAERASNISKAFENFSKGIHRFVNPISAFLGGIS